RRKFWLHALLHLSFVHNWLPKTQGSINGPNWSLGVEMQFYLLVLVATPWLKRARPLAVLAVCVAASWLWRAGVFELTHGRVVQGLNLTWFGIAQVPGALDEFGFGIVWAMLIHADRGGRLARRLHATRWLWPLAAALMAIATMHFYWKDPSF